MTTPHRNRSLAAAASLPPQGSWSWLPQSDLAAGLDGLSNTSPLNLDEYGPDFVLGADLSTAYHPGMQDLLGPPLFPPTSIETAVHESFIASSFVPFPESLDTSLDGLSPQSSSTLDADSVQSFTAASGSPLVEFSVAGDSLAVDPQGLPDAEFQWLIEGLSQETLSALPCEPFAVGSMPAVDDFAQMAFPHLDLFSTAHSIDDAVHGQNALSQLSMPVPGVPLLPKGQQFRCRSCNRAFPTLCRLRKHERTHTRPFSCSVCHKGHAAKKDLHRHLWTTHPEAAARAGIPSPMRTCPVDGCDYEARQDNLTRHMRAKHPSE